MTTYTIIGIIAVAAFIGIWWLVRVLPLMDERQDIWDALDVHLGIPKRYAKLRLRWWWPWGSSLRQYTPKGACVWGTVKVPQEQLESFDEGISRQIAASSAEFPHWKLFRKHSDYSALVIAPMATNHVNEPGSPALIVSTGNSQIQCAGVCLGTSWTPTELLTSCKARLSTILTSSFRIKWRQGGDLRTIGGIRSATRAITLLFSTTSNYSSIIAGQETFIRSFRRIGSLVSLSVEGVYVDKKLTFG